MSTQKNALSETAAVEETPAASHFEMAQRFVEQLRRMREAIPHFTVPTSKRDRSSLLRAASLPPEFMELASVARANHAALVRSEGTTPEEGRDLMEFADAYAPLADEFEAMADFVRFSTEAARSKVGREALITYSLANRLSRLPEHAELVPRVADMRRVLATGVKRTKAAVARKLKRAAAAAAAAAAAVPPASPADPSGEKQ